MKYKLSQNRNYQPFFVIIIVIFLWEFARLLAIKVLGVSDFFLPNSLIIAKSFISLFNKASTFISIFTTLFRVIIILAFVTIFSVCIGFFLGRNHSIYRALRPAWDFCRSIPPSSLFPVFLIIFGIGATTKVIIAIYFGTLLLSLNMADAMFAIDREREYTWLFNGVEKSKIYRYLILPELAAQLFSGMRVVASIIVSLVIITEMYLGSMSGIGGAIVDAKEKYNFPGMFSYITIAGILGYILNFIVDYLSQKTNH